jgi:nitroreductase
LDILEAIQARHSVRDFLSTPVPKYTIIQIMAPATRSPSGGNGQPWEVLVATGATLDNIRKAYRERAQAPPGGPGGPPPLPAFIQERMTTIRTRLSQSKRRHQHVSQSPPAR